MEAPERNKPLLLCQKCFAMIPDGAEYCAECGAPVVDDLVEGSDTAIYPELARANLLRMRGEYKVAEDICLAILRRHPNSATANTLLGDICADKGDLKQAADWYEMALDITPDSESDRTKLEAMRRRMKEHETAETAKHLGLPESKPKIGLWIGGVVVFVLLVATFAYLLGERTNGRSGSKDITAPVSVPLESTRDHPSIDNPKTDEKTSETPVADLLQTVRSAVGTEAGRVVGASRFPESLGVLLTLTATGSEDPRHYAAELGRQVLEKISDAPHVTTVIMKEGKVAYVGSIQRDKYLATTTEDWKAQHGEDARAFADAVLSDEWPPPAAPGTTSGTEPPPGDQTSTP